MKKIIFFRFEINKKIGTGHAVRCLRIANLYYDKKYAVIILLTRNSLKNLKVFNTKNFKIKIINKKNNSELDALETINKIKSVTKLKDIIIVKDDYKLNLKWDKSIRKVYENLVIIDDYLNKKHNCKIYINYNVNKVSQIKNKNENTKYLVGLKYFPYFRVKKKINKTKTCLLFFGGSDKYSLTLKFIKIITKLQITNVKFLVILGKFNTDKKKIMQYSTDNIQIVNKFIKLDTIYNRINFMICSGGTTLLEAISNNIYPIVVPSHKNHFTMTKYFSLKKKIILIKFNEFNFNYIKKELIKYFSFKKNTAKKKIIDNKGALRIFNKVNKWKNN